MVSINKFIICFRGLFLNSLKAFLIKSYGVDGYDKVIIYMNISGWVFSGLIFLSFLLLAIKLRNTLTN